MKDWLRYAAGFFIAAHGLVYFATPLTNLLQTVLQGWSGSSAVFGTALSADALKSVTTWLWILAGIGLVAAATTMVFNSALPGVWKPLAIGASLAGIASFVVFYDGQAQLFVDEGGIGLIISSAIAIGASVYPRTVPRPWA